MSDLFKQQVEDRIDGEDRYALPGSRRAAEKDRADAQQSGVEDFKDGIRSTAAAGIARVVSDEAPELFREQTGRELSFSPLDAPARIRSVVSSLAGFRAGEKDYDKDEKYDELTKDIPYEYHDDIMENDNFLAASRSRQRVLDDLERGRRMTQQDGGQLAALAGSLFDVDMPLTLMSGGAYGAAVVSRAALRGSRMARLSPAAAMRLSGSAQGLNAGLQAGVTVGVADAAVRETVGWQDVANMALMSMTMGGGIGGAVKGDVRVSVREAQKEFYHKIANDDPAFKEDVNVNDMDADNLLHFQRVEEGSIGAAQAQPVPRDVGEPVDGATPANMDWIAAARNWRDETGWQVNKDAADAQWWGKVAQSPIANMTTNNFTRLYKSKSAVANYIAGSLFESAGGLGRGRATAAIRMENYHKRIQKHLGEDLRRAQAEWAKQNDATWSGSGYHISEQGKAVFNREVMLELNDRAMGRSSTRNPEIKKAADQYELAGQEALSIGRGRDGETAIDGFDGLPDRRGYTPYKWSGAKINEHIKAGTVSEEDIVAAVAEGYRKAGLGQGKDAHKVAKAVVHRARTKEADIDTSVLSLLSGDGKDFLRDVLTTAGTSAKEVDAILQRLTGKQHEASKESFAKARNDIDMNATVKTRDGTDLRLVDLFDNDLHGVWQRYTRQISGSGALARHGITNRAQRKEIIAAMRAEQRALGEDPIDAGLIEAMMSHFNAGPVHGYGFGKNPTTNEGIGHAALAKRIANLSLLEKLGVTQIAETGVMIAQNGVANWMRRGPMAVLDAELKAGNKALLDDLAFFTGEIGQDHWAFAPWLDLDDTTRGERGEWLRAVNTYSSAGSFVQGYTSAFNQVRAFQQKTAALGVTDKVMRTVKDAMDNKRDYTPEEMARLEDLGLDRSILQDIESLVESGTIEFQTQGDHVFVNRLNMDQWSADVGENFASAVTRNINQVVQKSMAGEQDAWMHTHVGSILMHLKTFPLQAIQKQVLRQARFMDKEALATVLMGLATAAVAVKIRDTLDGRERDALDTAKAAFNYSNMTGWMPTFYDPVMSLIGMDNARVNAFGPHYDITPPTIKIANDMMRIPGAVSNTVQGNADWYDKQALKAIPFAGTYVLSQLFD